MGFWYQKAFTVKELLQKALVVIVTNKFHPVQKQKQKCNAVKREQNESNLQD